MSNPKHTPGPWEVFEGGRVISVELQERDNRPSIVKWMGFDDCDRTREEHLANARLIAAAPELLEALRELKRPGAWEHLTLVDQQRIEAAIAKAEGEL